MSLEHPWLLVTLLLVPAALGAYLLLARRRQRYPVRFTNLDGARRRRAAATPSWRTHLPAALLGLALVALAIAVARPGAAAPRTRRARDGDPRRRPVPLDGGAGRQALAPGGREGGGRRVPRARSPPPAGRHRHVLGRRHGRRVADVGPRAARALGRHDRHALGGVRRHRDRRRARTGGGAGTRRDARARARRRRLVARAGERRGGGDDPLPLGRAPEPRDPAARRGRAARGRGGDPRLHRRARHCDRRRPARRGRRLRLRQPRAGSRRRCG